MKKRRLSFQAIFAGSGKDDKDSPRTYKTLPRSFGAAYAAYYDTPFDPAALAASSASETTMDNVTTDSDSFLLDDDPFADLTGGPRGVDAPVDSPSSPLHSPPSAPGTTLPPAAPPPVTRTMTAAAAHTTPAHQKPAFRPRPSLPSLHTLAQMSVVVPHKVRRGRVGAGLPYEPWDIDTDVFTASPVSVASGGETPASTSTPATPPIPIPTSPKQRENDSLDGMDSMDMAFSTTPTPANPLPHRISLSTPSTPSHGLLVLEDAPPLPLPVPLTIDLRSEESASTPLIMASPAPLPPPLLLSPSRSPAVNLLKPLPLPVLPEAPSPPPPPPSKSPVPAEVQAATAEEGDDTFDTEDAYAGLAEEDPDASFESSVDRPATPALEPDTSFGHTGGSSPPPDELELDDLDVSFDFGVDFTSHLDEEFAVGGGHADLVAEEAAEATQEVVVKGGAAPALSRGLSRRLSRPDLLLSTPMLQFPEASGDGDADAKGDAYSPPRSAELFVRGREEEVELAEGKDNEQEGRNEEPVQEEEQPVLRRTLSALALAPPRTSSLRYHPIALHLAESSSSSSSSAEAVPPPPAPAEDETAIEVELELQEEVVFGGPFVAPSPTAPVTQYTQARSRSSSTSSSSSHSHSHSHPSQPSDADLHAAYEAQLVNAAESEDARELRARRRRFRKSSLVGDVLRFAPASPPAESAAEGVMSPVSVAGSIEEEDEDGEEREQREGGGDGDELLELSDIEMQVGDMDMALSDLPMEEVVHRGRMSEMGMEMEFEFDEGEEGMEEGGTTRNGNRASTFSMMNEVGHERLSNGHGYEGVGVAFPAHGGSPDSASYSYSAYQQLQEQQHHYFSPPSSSSSSAARSPEQYYSSHSSPYEPRSPERVASSSSSQYHGNGGYNYPGSPPQSHFAHSPPYSTPSAVSASASSASASASEWEDREGGREWDFGWLPGERAASLSRSGSSGSEFEGRGRRRDGTRNGVTPPPTPISGAFFSQPASTTSAYSDDELAFDFRQEGTEFKGAAFVFPLPPRLAKEEEVEPGTSAGTIRASAQRRAREGVRSEAYWTGSEREEEGEMVDGSGWERTGGGGGSGRGYTSGGGGGSGSGSGSGRAGGGNEGYYGGYGSNGGGSAGRDDGDDERRRRDGKQSSFSTPSSSSPSDESESESESDDYGEDEYGQPSAPLVPEANAGNFSGAVGSTSGSAKVAAPAATTKAGAESNSDDDIPLAQRIPSALVAQRTIRRKVREERDERRRVREERRALRGEGGRNRQTTLRPAGAGAGDVLEVASSSREAARQAEASLRASRTRTQTLPGSGPGTMQSAAVDDLTKKLQSMQSSRAERERALTINGAAAAGHALMSPSPARVSASVSPPAKSQPLPEGARGLRAMRSFHRPAATGASREEAPLPLDAEGRVRRSTTTRRPAEESASRPVTAGGAEPEGRVQRSGTTRRPAEESSSRRPPTADLEGRVQRSATARRAPDESRDAHRTRERALTTPAFLGDQPPPTPIIPAASNPAAPPPAKLTKPRPSGELPSGVRSPVDMSPQTHRHATSKSQGTLTRVFIGDMQRFNMVDIGPATSAKHVLTMVEEQGSLKGWVGTGGWMVWEIAQDFGMERPIRSFELLADVQASWNKDKMVNTFVIKLTPLAPILSRSNIPTSSPTYSGYVDWEAKRGKWTKRYLRLREHSLWLSKRESVKDEVFLCSLSNFDAYNVTRLHKAPKPFCFSVKSTDNLSFFENTADYLHMFACNPKDGEKWVEKILLARSYVLHQERNVLFNPKVAGGNASGASAVPGLSRAATRKAPSSAPPRAPPQPLVTGVAPLLVAPDRNDVFLPGSLLREQ